MIDLSSIKPKPDFETFKKVIMGKTKAKKVYYAELLFDEEFKKNLSEKVLGKTWIQSPSSHTSDHENHIGGDSLKEQKEAYWKQDIDFYYSLGFDFLPTFGHDDLFRTYVLGNGWMSK
ncbi:MAG: hypothetical protein JSV25_07185, partial [Spirochaetota bacterium]